jgi:hypothetical protein
MTKLKIADIDRGLYDIVSKIDHVAAVSSAVAEFTQKHCSTYGEVQDGLRDAFFKSAYGKAMYYDYHLPKYITARDALDQKVKNEAYLVEAMKKVDTKTITDATAQKTEAQKIVDTFTQAEKDAALDSSKAAEALHAPITGSNEYKYAISLAMKYVAEIKEAFLLTESAITGKLNFDLIQSAGRNLTLYDVDRLNETELAKVEAGYDWKTLFNDQNKSIVALQVKSGTPSSPTQVRAFVGGLANTIDFGSQTDSQKNIDAFVAWIESESTIQYVRERVIAKAAKGTALKEADQKAIAALLSLKLMQEVSGVEALWPPLESVVASVKASIEGNTDNAAVKIVIENALKAKFPLVDNLKFNDTTKKFELVPLTEVIKNNMFREGSEELAGIAFNDKAAIDAAIDKAWAAAKVKNPALLRTVTEKSIKNKTFALDVLTNHSSDEDRVLLVGGDLRDDSGNLLGLARDPQFPNAMGFADKNDSTVNRTALFAVPECYASRVSVDKSPSFRNDLAILKTMIGTGEMRGANLSSLWDATKYSGSVVNTEANFFTPLGSGANVNVLDPLQSTKTIATYHHEGQVPVIMMTRYVLAQSVAAVILKLKADFVKGVDSSKQTEETANFEEFLHYVQDLGFATALKKLTTGVIDKSDTDRDTQEKVDALVKIKFAAVAKLIDANKASIVADAKEVFETNYVGEKGLMTLLAAELSAKDEALNLEASADLIFWQTEDALACLAQNYFGDSDASLFGRDFARSMLAQASKIGVDKYVTDHQDSISQAQLEESFLLDLRTEEVNEINNKVLGLTGEDALAAYYETLVY